MLAGGKFANGAITGAFAQLYNAESLARAGAVALGAEAADGNPIAAIGLAVSTVAYGVYKFYDFVFAPADVGSGSQSDAYTVRLQAQGDDLEASVTIGGSSPITMRDGHLGLSQLQLDIGSRAAGLRGPGFVAASQFISACAAAGGCPQMNSKSFYGYKNTRIDINIIRGHNFILGGRSGATISDTVFGQSRR